MGTLGIQPPTSPSKTRIPAPQLTVYQILDSSISPNLEAPACRSLISRTFSPHEIISLIEVIFGNQNEIKMIGFLRGDDAQTFIDVIHGVRLQPLLNF